MDMEVDGPPVSKVSKTSLEEEKPVYKTRRASMRIQSIAGRMKQEEETELINQIKKMNSGQSMNDKQEASENKMNCFKVNESYETNNLEDLKSDDNLESNKVETGKVLKNRRCSLRPRRNSVSVSTLNHFNNTSNGSGITRKRNSMSFSSMNCITNVVNAITSVDKPTNNTKSGRRKSIVNSMFNNISDSNDSSSSSSGSDSISNVTNTRVRRKSSVFTNKNSNTNKSNTANSDNSNNTSTKNTNTGAVVTPKKLKVSRTDLETIFEEPLQNGSKMFSKGKYKRSIVLDGCITKTKMKNRKKKIKNMNKISKVIKKLKNKLTLDDLQCRLVHLDI